MNEERLSLTLMVTRDILYNWVQVVDGMRTRPARVWPETRNNLLTWSVGMLIEQTFGHAKLSFTRDGDGDEQDETITARNDPH